MNKIFCDRCERETDKEKNVTLFEPYSLAKKEGRLFSLDLVEVKFDLCDKCLEKLVNWIDRGEDNGWPIGRR